MNSYYNLKSINSSNFSDYNEETKTSPGTTPGLIMTTTITPDVASPRCFYKGKMFNDGDLLYSTEPCHHCYCFRGDIACAIQDCGKPMETHGKNCTASTPPEGECCPSTYECGEKIDLFSCIECGNYMIIILTI